MLTILPSTVWMSVAHPTEQNGQMLGVVLASLIRSSCARAIAGARVTPSPTSPPMAVPAPALAVRRRKSRRPTSIRSSALEMRWVREALHRQSDDIATGLGTRNPPKVIILTRPGGPDRVAVESGFPLQESSDARIAGAHAGTLRDSRGTRAAQGRTRRRGAPHSSTRHPARAGAGLSA